MQLAADEVQHREMFVLLDEQRDAYNVVLQAVSERAPKATPRRRWWSPGVTGKSARASSLSPCSASWPDRPARRPAPPPAPPSAQLARQGRTVIHATGSQSFTTTLESAARGAPVCGEPFSTSTRSWPPRPTRSSASSSRGPPHPGDLRQPVHPVIDAYRPVAGPTGLSAVTRVPVFLLDENQVVRPGEMGTVRDITAAAEERGIAVTHIDLDAQFRCGGSLECIDWVERFAGHLGGRCSSVDR